MIRALIAAAALALTACGGGGDSGATCASVHVQMFGDSIAKSYAVQLQILADQERGAGAVVVESRAVSGTSSQMLIDGTDRLNDAWPAGVGADVVFVGHGANDWARGTPIAQYVTNLRTFAANGARVIVPIPRVRYVVETGVYSDAARTLPDVIDADALVRSVPNWQAYMPDGTHPDAALSQIVARELLMPMVPQCGGVK